MSRLERPLEHKLLTQGVLEMISCSVKELPRKSMFGSTDRKSYTVEINLTFGQHHRVVYLEIDAWETTPSEVIESAKEEAKHKFANELYFEGALNT
jgi:hypothetical protein